MTWTLTITNAWFCILMLKKIHASSSCAFKCTPTHIYFCQIILNVFPYLAILGCYPFDADTSWDTWRRILMNLNNPLLGFPTALFSAFPTLPYFLSFNFWLSNHSKLHNLICFQFAWRTITESKENLCGQNYWSNRMNLLLGKMTIDNAIYQQLPVLLGI